MGSDSETSATAAAAQPSTAPAAPAADPAMPQFSPEMMGQFMQMFQRLPRGQVQRFQAIMQKAMAGKDVSREAAEFESTLPVEFQKMVQGMSQQVPNQAIQNAEQNAKDRADAKSSPGPAGKLGKFWKSLTGRKSDDQSSDQNPGKTS